MSLENYDDRSNKKRIIRGDSAETETGDTGSDSGGQSGQIEFRDFTSSTQHLRDDLLPADEKKRLLAIHKDSHELQVKKQKYTRDIRQQIKTGKKIFQSFRQGFGLGSGGEAGMSSQFKANPALANKAQFAGIDKQENPLPNQSEAKTNEGDRNELNQEYQKRYTPANVPHFNPKPTFNR